MWRLWNLLFGWDYIHWQNCADQGIARVQTDGRGVAYYPRYRLTNCYDEITDKNQVIWLTCQPEKYMAVVDGRAKP